MTSPTIKYRAVFAITGCLVLALVLVAGCASTGEIPTARYIPPEKMAAATLYVFRDTTMPTKANVQVQIDEQLVALLPPNRFTWTRVPPGRHVIAVGYPSFPDMRARLTIDFIEGETYVLHYDSKVGTENSLLGTRREAELGVTPDGRGGYTRIRLLPSANVSSVVQQYPYVPAAP